ARPMNGSVGLSEEFLRRAQKYSGGHVHFLIDGSNVATEGYKFRENDPPGLILETAMNLKIAMPHTGFSAAYWSGDKANVAVDLFRPSTWHKLIPQGRTAIGPGLAQVEQDIADGTLKTPLHLIAFSNMGVNDTGDMVGVLRRLRDTQDVTVDVIVLNDSMPNGYKAVRALSAENPDKPVNDFVILSPDELAAAVRTAVVTRTGPQMAAREEAELGGRIYTSEGVRDALTKGAAKGGSAPGTASFTRKH
ncbi:MAG TPA: hypothetical protein VEF76_04205, partial [Patescibacteria group bacterium]|nr:hypothetical protein [Patescibacteria group bacterium]